MVPSIGLGLGASNTCIDPIRVLSVPNPPRAGLLDGALCAKDVLDAVQRLIDVKLQRLWSVGIFDVEVNVIDEVVSAIIRAHLPPPQRRSVFCCATYPELSRLSSQ